MKRLSACLSVFSVLVITSAVFGGPLVDVQSMYNGDGTYSYWIAIDPNTGLDEVAFIDTTIKVSSINPNNKIHQFLERQTYGEVHLQSQQIIANIFDPTYPIDDDTVFADGAWPGVVGIQITPLNTALGYVAPPAPQPSLNGIRQMSVQAVSFTGGLGGPIPSGEFTPIWHLTTWGPGFWLTGVLQTESQPNGTFEWHCPEPCTAILSGLGALAVVASARRRRR